MITGTASVALLYTETVSSSVIYSSGSNQFGDASNDVQTLYGTVDIKNGPVRITGSVNITGSDLTIANGSKIIAHDINAGGANGIEINNNGGNPVALFGAGGSQGATFYGQINVTAISASSFISSSQFVGNLAGTASYATQALSASQAALAQTASFFDLSAVTQNAVFSGSVRGDVASISITSLTASLDLSTGNFFNLSLPSGSNTLVSASNIQPGQTVNIKITQPNPGFGTVTFPSNVKQVSGSVYVATTGSSAVDIVTLISWDSTNLYLANVKNLI
jgi:hypothetical protein